MSRVTAYARPMTMGFLAGYVRSYSWSGRNPSNKQMSVLLGASVSRPPGHDPNAHRSLEIGAFASRTFPRTVRVEWAVFVSPASYEVKLGLPSSVSVNVPARGIVRSEYSM